MGRLRIRFAAAMSFFVLTLGLPLALGACGDSDSPAVQQATHRDFSAENFPDAPKIDNEFSPLAPGTQFVFEGRSDRGQGRLPLA